MRGMGGGGMKPYYHDEKYGITIYHGDCLEIMPHLEPVDLVLTDPPYGLDKRLSQGAGKHKNSRFRLAYENEKWDVKISKTHFKLMFEASKCQIIFGANYYSMPPTRGIICWDKKQMMPTFSRWEYAWCNLDFPAKMYEVRSSEGLKEHPTQKPLKLFKQILNDFKSDTILDPFMGSGTTLVAAKELGWQAIGIEIEKKYCEIAARRLSQDVFQWGS